MGSNKCKNTWKEVVVSLYKVLFWRCLKRLGKSTKTPVNIVDFWTMPLRLKLACKKLGYYQRNCNFV